MIRVIHNQCGKVAFFFRKKLKYGDQMQSSNVLLLDGTPPKDNTIVICGSCLHPFIPGTETCEQQHWTDWFMKQD
jgi:hypothetical protein